MEFWERSKSLCGTCTLLEMTKFVQYWVGDASAEGCFSCLPFGENKPDWYHMARDHVKTTCYDCPRYRFTLVSFDFLRLF